MNDKRYANLLEEYRKINQTHQQLLANYNKITATLAEFLSKVEYMLLVVSKRQKAILDAAGIEEIKVEKSDGGILLSPGTLQENRSNDIQDKG